MSLITLASIQAFFGWCSLINFVLLGFAAFGLMAMRDTIMQLHSSMFGVEKSQLPAIYFKYLAYYKIAIIVFNFVPFLALFLIK